MTTTADSSRQLAAKCPAHCAGDHPPYRTAGSEGVQHEGPAIGRDAAGIVVQLATWEDDDGALQPTKIWLLPVPGVLVVLEERDAVALAAKLLEASCQLVEARADVALREILSKHDDAGHDWSCACSSAGFDTTAGGE